MKHILCFGDSNTWGYSPQDGSRFPPNVRWTGTLQKTLGADYNIIEEGLNGRTTFINEEGEDARPFRSGSDVFSMILESHRPLDLVTIMLGTNDLKLEFNLSVEKIAQGVKELCEIVLSSEYLIDNPPKLLLISPIHIGSTIQPDQEEFFEQAREKSYQFAEHYQRVAEELGIHFLDAAKIVSPSDGEGVHWDADQHIKFGKVLAQKATEILL
jgi:lysophospholipase L1-like esterase